MNNARAAMITDMTDATARIFCQSTGFRNLGLWSTYRLPLLVIATSSITCPSDHAHRARPSRSSASNPYDRLPILCRSVAVLILPSHRIRKASFSSFVSLIRSIVYSLACYKDRQIFPFAYFVVKLTSCANLSWTR